MSVVTCRNSLLCDRTPQPSTSPPFLHQTTIPAITTANPTSHSQYFSRKPSSCISCFCGATITGGLDSTGKAAGASGSTMGASAITGAGGIGGALRLATLFLGFGAIGSGAGGGANEDSASTSTGAGAVTASASASGCGAAGSWTAASTGAGAAAGTASGLVAQADKANAEINRMTGSVALSVLDMAFSPKRLMTKIRVESSHRYHGRANIRQHRAHKDLTERSQNPGRIKL